MISVILVLLFAHFFADFVVQPEKLADNKWYSNKALGIHVLLYTASLFLISWLFLVTVPDLFLWSALLIWSIVNGMFHFIVDYATSRDMKMYRDEKDYRMFFIMLGFDQMVHYAVLAVTYSILITLL